MFRSRYKYTIEDGILVMIDLDGDMSLTNDMENALAEIEKKEGISLEDSKITYQDSLKCFDGVSYKNGVATFYPIGQGTLKDALEYFKQKN